MWIFWTLVYPKFTNPMCCTILICVEDDNDPNQLTVLIKSFYHKRRLQNPKLSSWYSYWRDGRKSKSGYQWHVYPLTSCWSSLSVLRTLQQFLAQQFLWQRLCLSLYRDRLALNCCLPWFLRLFSLRMIVVWVILLHASIRALPLQRLRQVLFLFLQRRRCQARSCHYFLSWLKVDPSDQIKWWKNLFSSQNRSLF